jgi:CheY-like chemotaxis protein
MQSGKKPIVILMADDDDDDRLMAAEAFAEQRLTNLFFTVADGEELLDYLHHRGEYHNEKAFPAPGLILLDLNMPKKDGREALAEIKSDPRLKHIPIVVLTTSKAEEDILRTYNLGVNSFIIKPVTFERLAKVLRTLTEYWFEIVEIPSPAKG